jgi:hypothetical protein
LLGVGLLALGLWSWPRPSQQPSDSNSSGLLPGAQPQSKPLTIDLRVFRCDPDAFNFEVVGSPDAVLH